MSSRQVALTAAILALTAVSFFWIPGHTILLSDTQIYLPILERLHDPAVLANDPMAVRPHVTYTIYDEVALVLRRLTGAGFEPIVLVQQFLYRALGILGLLLIGTALRIPAPLALLLAGLVSLGASVNGPAVLTVEYEPVPRAFAMPFLLLSLGLAAHRRWVESAAAATIGFLFHPPTSAAYCGLFALAAVWRRQWRALLPFLAGAAFMVLLVFVPVQPHEGQHILSRVDPSLEKIQRMRANYNWVSVWLDLWIWHYLGLCALAGVALWRLWRVTPPLLRLVFAGLPAAGLLSLPVSHYLLEHGKWLAAAQVQPGRYLVFVTLCATLLAAAAGTRAAMRGRWLESWLFLLFPFAITIQPRLAATLWPTNAVDGRRLACAAGLALLAAAALRIAMKRHALAVPVLALALGAAYLGLPAVALDGNRPIVHSQELDALAAWARESTDTGAVFFFPGAGRSLEPGVFRARALRAVYVDWKSGGQVNFLRNFAMLWWDRWNRAQRAHSFDDYRGMGIDYVVFSSDTPELEIPPVYRNARYTVYALR